MYNKHLIIYFLFLIFVNVSICLQPGPLALSARRTELIESQSCERSGWSCKDCSTLQSCSQNNIFKFQISCADQYPDRPYCNPKLGLCSSDRHVCSEMKDPEFICPGVGIYPDLTDCRRYISCKAKGEIGLIYSCLYQSVFNAKLKRCITNSNCYDPIIECNGQFKTMAYAPDPSLYIVCRGDQKPLIKDCGNKRLEYDPTLLECDFKCKDEGRFAHPTNNTLYYVCIYNGNEIVRMMSLCLPGTVFDEYYATCVYDFKTTTQQVTELETITEEILSETTTEFILETAPIEVIETTIANEEIVENTETINNTENGNKSNYINRNIEPYSETHFFEKIIEFTTENGPTTIEDETKSETTTLNDEQNTETILGSTTNNENLTEMPTVNTEGTTNTEPIVELTTNNENIGETTVVNTEVISDITTNNENQDETTTNNEDSETTTENAFPGQETSTTEKQTTAEVATTIDPNENVGNTTNSSEESLETTEKNDTQEETTEDITKEDVSNEKTEENTKEDETTEKQSNEDDNDDTNEKTEEDTKEDVEDETKEKSNEDDNDTNENTEENTKEDEDEETTERNSNEEEEKSNEDDNDTNEKTEENTKEDKSKESKENNSHANKSKEKSNESKDKKHKCKGIRCIAEWKIPGFLKRKDP